jgi:hypothetical protein
MQPPTCTLVPKPASLEELIQKAKTFVAAAKAPATLKAYRTDWRDFESWCRPHQLPSLPSTPETVALYIADRASTLASGTITRRLTSITKAHQAAGFTDSPATTRHFVVGETLKGVRRTFGTRAAWQGPAPFHRHPPDHHCPARGSPRTPRCGSGSGWIRGRLPTIGTRRHPPM